MKKYIFLLILSFCSVIAMAGDPPFKQSDISTLNQQQISLFGSPVFNSTSLKAVLMHTNNIGGVHEQSYSPKLGYSPDSNYSSSFLSSLFDPYSGNSYSYGAGILQEFTLANNTTLEYLFPVGHNPMLVSVIWDNPQGDVEFGQNADRSIYLQDDIDVRIKRKGYYDSIVTYYPFVFSNRYVSNDNSYTHRDNAVDNMEQVFAMGDITTGMMSSAVSSASLESSSVHIPDMSVASVKISHKGTLSNGSKNISIAILGIDNTYLPHNDTIGYGSGYDYEYSFAQNNIERSYNIGPNSYLVAGRSIAFKPGFKVTSYTGSQFRASINPLLVRKYESSSSLRSSALKVSSSTTGISEETMSGITNYLYQNTPNPFTESSNIRYAVQENAASAFIGIYDLQGQLVRKLKVGSGTGEISIQASGELKPGMYIYSLFVDGAKFGTKKMVVQ
jgi:Secretion system C-terminal sorting domain